MKQSKGEIATILTISALIVIGLSTLISNVFLKQKNITKSKAMEEQTPLSCPCEENGECVPCSQDNSSLLDIVQPSSETTSQQNLPASIVNEGSNDTGVNPQVPAQEQITPTPPWWTDVLIPSPDQQNESAPATNCPSGYSYDDTYGSCMPNVVSPFQLPTPTPQWTLPWDPGWKWGGDTQVIPSPSIKLQKPPPTPPNIEWGNPFQWIGDRFADLGGIKDQWGKPNPQDYVNYDSGPHELQPTVTPKQAASKNWWDDWRFPWDAQSPTIVINPTTSSISIIPTNKVINNTPTPESEKVDFGNKSRIGTVRLVKDVNGIPTKIVVSNGQEFIIDQNTRDKILALKQQGRLSEPEIIKLVRMPLEYGEPKEDPVKHPVLKELPADVLTKDGLETKGINIYQSKITNLFIRDSAFAEDGPLGEFAKYKKIFPDAQLNIVLCDGGSINEYYCPKNILPKEIQERLHTDFPDPSLTHSRAEIENLRQSIIQDFELELNEVRKQYKQSLANNDNVALSLATYKIKDIKTNMEIWKTSTSEDILTSLSSNNINSKEKGFFYQNLGTTPHSATVFVSVGNNNYYSNIVVVMEPDGNIHTESSGTLTQSYIPNRAESRPNPESFSLNRLANPNDPASYPYGAQHPGQVLRHEIEHFNLIQVPRGLLEQDLKRWGQELANWYKIKDNPNPEPRLSTTGKPANLSEYDTDMAAMKGIQKAWEKCKEKQFQNCSEYSFIFSLPDNSGFIETHQKPTPPPQRKL